VFYIDHNSKTTTWTRPPPPPASDASPPPSPHAPSPPPEGASSPRESAAAAAAPSYDAFGRTVDEMRSKMLPSVVHGLTELFQLNGDVHAALYTGSRALNSAMMHLLDGSGSRRRGGVSSSPAAATATQISISVQRRFVNLTLDSSRQLAFEAFLGMHAAGVAEASAVPTSTLGRLRRVLSGSEEEAAGQAVVTLAAPHPPRSERLFSLR
jgi:hypothetical protein